jgi:acyl carrier protein
MDSILKELQEIFRDVLDQPELVLTRESNASNVEDWDSLGQINLVTVIEKRYKIKFELAELEKLNDVGDMIDLINVKVAPK